MSLRALLLTVACATVASANTEFQESFLRWYLQGQGEPRCTESATSIECWLDDLPSVDMETQVICPLDFEDVSECTCSVQAQDGVPPCQACFICEQDASIAFDCRNVYLETPADECRTGRDCKGTCLTQDDGPLLLQETPHCMASSTVTRAAEDSDFKEGAEDMTELCVMDRFPLFQSFTLFECPIDPQSLQECTCQIRLGTEPNAPLCQACETCPRGNVAYQCGTITGDVRDSADLVLELQDNECKGMDCDGNCLDARGNIIVASEPATEDTSNGIAHKTAAPLTLLLLATLLLGF